MTSGQGSFKIDGQEFVLHAGDLFLIPPGHLAAYQADAQNPWEYYWVGFNGTEASRLIHLTPFEKDSPVICGGSTDPERLKRRLLHIYRSSGSMPENDVRMVGYLYLFLAEIIQGKPVSALESSGAAHLKKALKYIQYNYASPISVDHIAEYVGVSRSHLYRIFNRQIGLSPSEFLQKYRMNEACSLLRKKGLTIWEVAHSVGFSDALYFSRVFKKVKGVSPSHFIEENS